MSAAAWVSVLKLIQRNRHLLTTHCQEIWEKFKEENGAVTFLNRKGAKTQRHARKSMKNLNPKLKLKMRILPESFLPHG